ncbi:MAG: cellulase family glycosylhydrolase [Armatimonadetes bacterium]|nr:cellulase family glycosylhydrolase [Armatimonadota bacterium]
MRRYGFNFLWMYNDGGGRLPSLPDENALDFMVTTGFDFVRIPANYGFWIKDFDYYHPDETILAYFDKYLASCQAHSLHMSLNLHRAPGYCINNNERERHNLWLDPIAQDAFVWHWELFARRYLGVSSDLLSFDLLNEPPGVGQYGLTREIHADLMRRTAAAIRAIDPEREIVIDGLGGGHLAMPELSDLGAIHSGRGYQPMPVSHHQARWWKGHTDAPYPMYPGQEWQEKIWNRDTLREFYQPWRDVEAAGARIHIGECGCYNKTPNDIAMRWFADLFGLYKEFGWGFALWNFKGDFGVAEHGRPGASYEEMHGFQVDRAFMDLLLENRLPR